MIPFARCLALPSPRTWGEVKQAISFSRCLRIRVVSAKVTKATNFALFLSLSLTGKKEAERRQALCSNLRTVAGAARALRSALAYRRSTAALQQQTRKRTVNVTASGHVWTVPALQEQI
jgi:hypothetical protein